MRSFVPAMVCVILFGSFAQAEIKNLPHDARFCRSWAEAHERTLASLNNGRPPYPVKWKGCILIKKGAHVDVVSSEAETTEIIVKGAHLFTDEELF